MLKTRLAHCLTIVASVAISMTLTDSLSAQTAAAGGAGAATGGAARGTTGTTGTAGATGIGGATQAGGGGTAAAGTAAAAGGINTGAGGGEITVDFGGGFVGRSQNAGNFIGGNQNAGGAGGGRVATPNFGATTNNQFSAARGGTTAGRGATTGRASGALNNLLRGGGGLGGTTSRGVFRPRQRIAFSFPPRASSVISSRVTTKVTNVMVKRPQLSGVNVQVADGGVVTLNGQVDSEATKKLAGFLVLMEPGVRSIENELVIEPSVSTDVAPPAIP